MSRKGQLFKVIQKTFRQISKQFLSAINKQIIWLLRTISGTRRRPGSVNAGFILPTVAMVTLVVVLLTTAILFRSFERSKNASNVRVNEAVLNAATPAIDRARAKLDKLFDDRRLPRATPSDKVLESTLSSTANLPEYTFGDETPLKVSYTYTTPPVEGQPDPILTAWMFPVDTNNNGKFDTYTLYGIYFKTPPISGGTYSRARNPLEARTPPMTSGNISTGCQDTLGTSATLVGNTGWINIASKLKKSFFVYTANVPITTNPPNTGSDAGKYEVFQGNKGFSGLEYQQDRIQLPLVNNAVVYDDDIEITPGVEFNLNGRILTNSNLLTGTNGSGVTLYQVSSENSCFYDDDNAKIVVGGNLAAGVFTGTGDLNNSTSVHLFQGQGVDPIQNVGVTANKSISPETPNNIAYNSLAYVQRINLLVQAQTANAESSDPQEVKDGITQQLKVLNLTTSTATASQLATIRNNQLQLYFKKRTRRVPYGEVGFGGIAIQQTTGVNYTTTTVLQGSGDSLRPPDTWVYPFKASDGKSKNDGTLIYANLTLNISGSNLLPKATETTKQQKLGKEQYVGDRILLGNNLPALWWNTTTSTFVGSDSTDTQDITGINWDDGDGTRNRRSRVQQLADLGTVDRDGDWESTAATIPSTPQDSVGGLRVVTGAGIYLPNDLFVSSPSFSIPAPRIWSDMMPVPSGTATVGTSADARGIIGGFNYSTIQVSTQPYLRMRATAVYHYQASGYSATNPAPIACISSYYDPTNSTTAKNLTTLPYNNTGGNSNNGIVYAAPTKAVSDYLALLTYQASLKYPNGRLVNELLKTALPKAASSRTLSEQSAIHAAICAIQILDGSIGSPSTSVIPHGAIYETAFLDARQIKAIHKDVSTPGVETFTNADGVNGDGTGTFASVPSVPDPSAGSTAPDYELAKETRQPLEIRATVLDISKLRATTYGTATSQEYLIPNSGIIYATRDDALLDLSASSSSGIDAQKTSSPVDFKLDPTRRPNAIMLMNGDPIWRVLGFRDAEKGLILASNLPVYIKGDFNKHTQEEFNTALSSNLNNFYSRAATDRNPNFACRTGDARLPNCTTGDAWRPASVLSDAITLLSNNFQFGYRSDGDYDLNNNLGDTNSITGTGSGVTPVIPGFQKNGFATNNTNVVNALWYDPTNTSNNVYPVATINSSYLNNFVTPIQRRRTAPEYLMEVCPKLPVSACDPGTDWWVALPADVVAYPAGLRASDVTGTPGQTFSLSTHLAGTTAQSPTNSKYLGYPRRVAFLRSTSAGTLGQLTLDASTNPKPIIIGIQSGKITSFPLSSFSSTNRPDPTANALWFLTSAANDDNQPPNFTLGSGTSDQPALSPMLQIKVAFNINEDESPISSNNKLGPGGSNNSLVSNWMQQASSLGTTFNLVVAGGDTPARPTEENGGLQSFVRFLENWNPTGGSGDAITARINGSFIQRTRSVYATAPIVAYLSNAGSSLAPYPIANASGQIPFLLPPKRQWGYDVALLSQSPDAFSQKLAITPDDKPNEYFREVGRDDAWVQTLLCAKKASDSTYAVAGDHTSCS
ncbi:MULTISPECIES: hormogonium polysaccharide biosynthesis protein HpsA [unclassified Nostoc]|uniref:hormogonium polysaccharide biosynthesis protein HpsA n=1 Tax=unclassified Nostoc TaxID=2593658 RepID=UPI00261B007C|nr:hormogonium polysaccharide biosynthesis protein HpsA [Nostoc sp. S13]MDF5735120.1 hormogonium polysaccharide biosynthesis protein HpsA [Nostoc sp. S13]